tara:strand:- start:496 stop:2181 length:1686 start_codon:yes stop_codon:yes gene_type:complete
MPTIEEHNEAYKKALAAGDTLAAFRIKQLVEKQQQQQQQQQQLAVGTDIAPRPESTLLSRTGDILERRRAGIQETFDRPLAVGQGVLDPEALDLSSKVLFTVGDVFGGSAEVGGEIILTSLEAATPDFVLEGLDDALTAISENPIAQEGIILAMKGKEFYDSWATDNKDTAKTLESWFNISSFMLPATKTPEGLADSLEEITNLAADAGRTLESRGANLVKTGRAKIQGDKTDKVAHMLEPGMSDIPADDFDVTSVTGAITYNPKRPFQAQNVAIVSALPGVNPNKSYTYNAKVIQAAANSEKARLESILGRTEASYDPEEVVAEVIRRVNQQLSELGELDSASAKSVARALAAAQERMSGGDGSLLDLLNARRDFDSFFRFQKSQNMQAGATLDQAKTFARNAMNDILGDLSANSTVKESLRKQTAYLGALDTLLPKRAKDARGPIERLSKFSRRFLPTTVGAQVATAGIAAGALATYWPLLTVPAIMAIGFGGAKAALSPEARVLFGEMVKQTGTALRAAEKEGAAVEVLERIKADRLVLINLLNETPVEVPEEEDTDV